MTPSSTKLVLLAGGGTGGHIFPNLAILERLRERADAVEPHFEPHFLVSQRPLDAQLLAPLGLAYTAVPAAPLSWRPAGLMRFWRGYMRGKRLIADLIRRRCVAAMVATGGFVCGPAVAAAHAAGVPIALVNLDAVPGRANAWAARRASAVFSVYDTPLLPGAQRIGLPLRRDVICDRSPAQAREALGLAPDQPVLLVTAGSQGAVTINRMMMTLTKHPQGRAALADWQVYHLSGARDREAVERAYAEAGVAARVEPFCQRMGLAWRSAELAISRAGAGSVAEVLANAVPTIFLPYPYHKDQHQRLNALPLADAGGAVLVQDHIDAEANVQAILPLMVELMRDDARRQAMRAALASHQPPDGAQIVADWVLSQGLAG